MVKYIVLLLLLLRELKYMMFNKVLNTYNYFYYRYGYQSH